MPPQQKRSLEEFESFVDGVKVLLIDIEGTTTPINFVKDKLFPYVLDNLQSYLESRFDEDETQKDIAALRDLAVTDKDGGDTSAVQIPEAAGNKDEVIKAVAANVKAQMTADRKSTALKQFQGHIWREAYKTKKIVGELFEDVFPVIQQLNDEEYKMYIYSSGSVEAQKLLFSHSIEGDITECFSGYFDSSIGSKLEAASYKKIREEVEKDLSEEEKPLEGDDMLFLTDNPAEATAACEAGLRVVIVDRSKDPDQEGGIELSADDHKNFPVIENFNDLFGEDEDEDEQYGQMKRQHLAGNGDLDDDDDDDDDEVDEEGDLAEEDEENLDDDEEGAEEDEEDDA